MFQELPVSEKSLSMRGVVYGVGTNDADYITQRTVNGIKLTCPFYSKWNGMLSRCYSVKLQKRYPTYKGCIVSPEWLIFSNFKCWMIQQDWKGKHLDKDLLVQGSRVYSPETCLFVGQSINLLLNVNKATRGKYPLGASFNKKLKRFVSKVVIDGKSVHLGYFDTPEEASEAYKVAKYAHIKEVALNQVEPLRSALLNYKIK